MKKEFNKVPTEAQEAVCLKKWSDLHPIAKEFLFHIPNGGSRNKIEARNLKLQGTKSGVSDYFFAYPSSGKYGLWLELKRKDKKLSKVSKNQNEWLRKMKEQNYDCFVAYGWEDACKKIISYLGS